MNLDFKPTGADGMKKSKDLINFEDNQEQREDIEKVFSDHKPYQVEKKSKLARAQYYMVLAHTQKIVTNKVEKDGSYLIHHVQEAVYS